MALPTKYLTPTTLTTLRAESDLLHLLYHRNKNQHRLSKWWKWFAMLRRHVNKLLAEAVGLSTSVAAFKVVTDRLVFMRRVIVPHCYTAFSSLVANNRFSGFGMVLLGCLARVYKIIGPEEKEGKEKVGVKGKAKKEIQKAVESMETNRDEISDFEEFGETVQRDEYLERSREEEREDGEEEEEEEEETVTAATLSDQELEHGDDKQEQTNEEDTGGKSPDHKTAGLKANDKRDSGKAESHLSLKNPKVKGKRRLEDETSIEKKKKKKKRRKNDEIDDLFSELL